MIRARNEEGGQALAIAAAGAFVLAVALALTIDWGYALVQRRIAQNDADKVAVEVGRLLTSSVALSGNTPFFAVAGRNSTSVTRQTALTHVDACTAATSAYQRDRSTPGANPAIWLDFEQWSGGTSLSSAPTSFVRANCARGKPRTVAVDRRTTTVHVRVEFTYRPIFALLLRQPQVIVGATSRIALAGAPYTVDPVDEKTLDARASVSQTDYAELAQSASAVARTWPLVRRYNPSDLSSKRPCGPPCDPTTATPLEFVSGGKITVLDLSSQSARKPGAEQLITEPEPGTSLFDWFADGFGGVLGLATKWAPLRTAAQDSAPSLAINRSPCRNVPGWLAAPPSCQPDSTNGDESTRGDWIETIPSPSIATVVGDMQVLIQSRGTTTAYSTKAIPNTGGRTYGRALVVWIYLWDCGQNFGNIGQWEDSSCASSARTDRVHLFSVVPVTFYEGLLTNSSIKGYWGGNFVDPGRCRAAPGSCPALTPLANSAFLIADDQRWDPTADGVDEDQNNGDECEGGGGGENCD
ncbi:MAG: hypothetical protein M3R37_04985 [Actinomycetota bacterium]|nr:hypothetical protein [Actinomycetota bacterium]